MTENDRIRASISATISEIAATQQAFAAAGIDVREPADREAYDIICRIERRLARGQQGSAA